LCDVSLVPHTFWWIIVNNVLFVKTVQAGKRWFLKVA